MPSLADRMRLRAGGLDDGKQWVASNRLPEGWTDEWATGMLVLSQSKARERAGFYNLPSNSGQMRQFCAAFQQGVEQMLWEDRHLAEFGGDEPTRYREREAS